MKKRIISFLLVVVMVVAMIPAIALPTAAAAENTESKSDYMAYVTNPTFDGKNTNGEYDNAYSIPFAVGLWGATATGNESLRVVYSDDAIYVLLESKDTTDNGTDDLFALSFAIGTSYVATQIDYRTNAPQHTNQGGTVSMSTTWSLNATYFIKTVTADGIAFEAKFPVANMSAEDQAAFADGTLSVKVGAFICDNWTVTETFSGIYNNRTSATTSIISGATALTFAEKFEYPDATVNAVHYVKNPTLDGVNSNGEYDNSYGKVFDVDFWSAPSGNESMKVMYSDSGIYLLLESIDDVANSDDWFSINFKVGASYVGYLQFNRLNSSVNSVYTNAGEVSMSADWMRRIDTAAGFSAEVFFPVSSMTADDQAAFAAGTLEIRFSVCYLDAWGGGKNGSSRTDANAAYSLNATAYNNAPALTIMPKGMVEDKTVVEADMTFIADAKYDGLNTNGEYDKAETIVLDNKVVGTVKLPSAYGDGYSSNDDVPAGSYYKVIYADDGIYVFVNVADTTPAYYYAAGAGIQNVYGFCDQMSINYSIGNSFIGKDYAYRHGTMGATNTGAGTLSGYPSTQKDNNTAGWTYEIKFPYSGMTDEDKAAFDAGTLTAKFSVTIADRMTNNSWGFYDGVIYNDGGLYEFNLAAKGTNYADEIVFDGVNTDREYNTATVITYPYGIWGYTPVGNETMKVVYTNEAIYVLVELVDTTPDVGTEDFHYLHISIGESFIGSKISNKDSLVTDEDYVNVGGKVDLKSYQTVLFKETHTETGYTIEARFPVSLMTETDKAAYAAGTLRVAFAGVHCDNWNIALSVEGIGYSSASADSLAAIPAIELAERTTVAGFAGANLSLGENINVNYYANIPYNKAANAFVKFTYNGKSYIARPVAATNKVDYYVFTFEGLAPQCMGDNIKAELIVDEEVVATKEEYSALQNCKNIIANEATSENVKQLVYDLLAYGAAAQKYAGYKTDALVNAGYEDLASDYDLYPSVEVAIDGANTNGEYDGATTIAIGNTITEGAILPSGSSGTFSGTAPTGSYYKVLLTNNAIYVYVNIADTTTSYYSKTADSSSDNGSYYYADQMSIIYSIGNSFIGKDWGYRHGTMGATNTGTGTLGSYPSKQKDNGAEGWGYEIVFPVSGMTAEDQAAYAAGTLSINFNVAVADNSRQGWGFSGVLYSDNATLDAYTSVSVIDKAVSAPSVDGAAFAAAGVYHANANKIYAKVALNGKFDVSAYTVTIDGVEATLEATETKGVYIVYTDDVKVMDFDKVYSFVLSEGENSQTLDYSINAYSIIKAANGKTEATKEIAKAMYNYGVSAEACVAG